MRGLYISALIASCAIAVVFAAAGSWVIVAAWMYPIANTAYYLGRHNEQERARS